MHSLRGERRTLGDAEESGSGGSISYRPIGLRLTIHVSMASPHSPFKSRAADYRRDEMILLQLQRAGLTSCKSSPLVVTSLSGNLHVVLAASVFCLTKR